MASKIAMLSSRSTQNLACLFGFTRLNHVAAIPPSFDGPIQRTISPLPFALPEFDREHQKDGHFGLGFPSFSLGGSMELMAVPKRKTSPHKRGIRNGPKALKPVPVIIRCRSYMERVVLYEELNKNWQYTLKDDNDKYRSCGKVKLPHYYCCSGHGGNTGERET